MKVKTFLALMFVFAFSCSECLAIEQTRFHSKANGYSLGVPKGWTRMPDSVLQEKFKQLFAKAAEPPNFVWEVAFQRDASSAPFQYPYTIVQVMKYSNFGLNRQPYPDEAKKFTKAMTGLDVEDMAEKMLSADVQELVSATELGKALWDSENKSYLINVDLNVTGIGKAKGQIKGYFGKYAMIQVMFYDLESNWNNSKLARNTTLSSFDFDPSMGYDEALKNKVGIFDRLGQDALKGLAFTLFFVVLGLICGLYKLATILIQSKKKPNDEQKQ